MDRAILPEKHPTAKTGSVIHYNNALHPERNSIPACRPSAGKLKTTTDRARVTCKVCLKMIGQDRNQKKLATSPTQEKDRTKSQAPSGSTPRLEVTVSENCPKPGQRCISTRDVFSLMEKDLSKADREKFIALHLDAKNRVIAKETVAIGSQTAVIVHPREVFKGAVLNGTASIVCVHNHPSGDPTPSEEDIQITDRLVMAGDVLGIMVLDHIILGDGVYFSFSDSGKMPAADFTTRYANAAAATDQKTRQVDLLDVQDDLSRLASQLCMMGCLHWRSVGQLESAQSGVEVFVEDIATKIEGIIARIGKDTRTAVN